MKWYQILLHVFLGIVGASTYYWLNDRDLLFHPVLRFVVGSAVACTASELFQRLRWLPNSSKDRNGKK